MTLIDMIEITISKVVSYMRNITCPRLVVPDIRAQIIMEKLEIRLRGEMNTIKVIRKIF